MQTGQRAGEARNLLGSDTMAEGGVALGDPSRHRASLEFLQTFVDAAHATPEATSKNDSGDVRMCHQ